MSGPGHGYQSFLDTLVVETENQPMANIPSPQVSTETEQSRRDMIAPGAYPLAGTGHTIFTSPTYPRCSQPDGQDRTPPTESAHTSDTSS